MTVKQLKFAISELPDEMTVHYNYDTGHSFPELEHSYVADLSVMGECDGPTKALILDVDPKENNWRISASEL